MSRRHLIAVAAVTAALAGPAFAVNLVETKVSPQNPSAATPSAGPGSTEVQQASAEPSALLLGLAAVIGIGYVVGRRSGRD